MKSDIKPAATNVIELQPALPIEFDDPIRVVFDFWKAVAGHERSQLGDVRRLAIRKALAMGYTVDDLRLAILGCKVSNFHQGQNDRATAFDDIELICRNEVKIDYFLKLGEKRVNEAIAKQEADEKRLAEEGKPRTPIPPNVRAMLDKLYATYLHRRPK